MRVAWCVWLTACGAAHDAVRVDSGDGALVAGDPKAPVSAAAGEWRTFWIDVPPHAASLGATTMLGSGEVDLYLQFAEAPTLDAYAAASRNTGTDELAEVTLPRPGPWFVGLYAREAFRDVRLDWVAFETRDVVVPGELHVAGIALYAGETRTWSFDVPADARVEVQLGGAEGDADLLVKQGEVALCSSQGAGSGERCAIQPEPGMLQIDVEAVTDLEGLELHVVAL